MWYIKQQNKDLFIRSEIDSGGMSVFWVGIQLADEFKEETKAVYFSERIKKHYPNEQIEVIFVA